MISEMSSIDTMPTAPETIAEPDVPADGRRCGTDDEGREDGDWDDEPGYGYGV